MFEYAITAVLFSESVPANASTAVLVDVPAIRPQTEMHEFPPDHGDREHRDERDEKPEPHIHEAGAFRERVEERDTR